MTSEKNKALIREFYDEFYNRKNYRVIDDLFSEDYIHHSPDVPGYAMGYQDFRKRELEFVMAFPDCRNEIEDQIAEEDKVATRAIVRGTQTGDMPNIPASNKRIEVRSIVINKIKDGRIVEGWRSYDSLGMMQQLEVVSMLSTLSKALHERGDFAYQFYK